MVIKTSKERDECTARKQCSPSATGPTVFQPPTLSLSSFPPPLPPLSIVGNDRDLTIFSHREKNLPTLFSFSFSLSFFLNFISNACILHTSISPTPLPPRCTESTRRRKARRRSGIALLDFSRRESRRLRRGGTGDERENTISLAVRERKREREREMTCSNVTLALLFQRQGEEKLGPSFLFNCHELQDKQFPRLSFLLRKPRFRNRPPDGQSVNDSIFHYHWNVSQLRLNSSFPRLVEVTYRNSTI